jgi:hypothetical protein
MHRLPNAPAMLSAGPIVCSIEHTADMSGPRASFSFCPRTRTDAAERKRIEETNWLARRWSIEITSMPYGGMTLDMPTFGDRLEIDRRKLDRAADQIEDIIMGSGYTLLLSRSEDHLKE